MINEPQDKKQLKLHREIEKIRLSLDSLMKKCAEDFGCGDAWELIGVAKDTLGRDQLKIQQQDA